MNGKPQHNYQWLFGHLAEALNRAENDIAFNRHYGFYAQHSIHVQFPARFLEELVVKYSAVTGLKLSVSQLRTKIANTRVKAFIAMAETTNAPWGPLMRQVNNYDPKKLLKLRPPPSQEPGSQNGMRKRAHLPRVKHNDLLPVHQSRGTHTGLDSSANPGSRADTIALNAGPGGSQPSTSHDRPASIGTVLNSADRIENAEVGLDAKLSALDKLSGASNLCTVYDSLMSGELKMAFLLSQHLKLPAISRV